MVYKKSFPLLLITIAYLINGRPGFPAVISYSTYLGGSSSDVGYAISTDSAGNVYASGYTWSSNFPVQDPYQGTQASGANAFVFKLSQYGSALLYSTYLGGSSDDYGRAISSDSSGSTYIAGYTNSSDFPTQNPYQGTRAGDWDAFILKISPSGSYLSFSTYLGGISGDRGYAISADSTGSAYVTGNTTSTDFPTQNPYLGTLTGGADAFVSKLSQSGNSLSYSTFLGGNSADQAYGVSVDSSGNAYIAGDTYSTDFPTQNPYQGTNAGDEDAFVTRFSQTGESLLYSTYLGGSFFDVAYTISTGSSENAYVGGNTGSSDFPAQNPYQGTLRGPDDAFIAMLSQPGGSLLYSTYMGGDDSETVYAIAASSSGNAYVTGFTSSSDFPTQNPFDGTNSGLSDAFVARLTQSGSALSFSTCLGGSSDDYGQAISTDSSGNAYVAGYTISPDFPAQNPYQETKSGSFDTFVSKIRIPLETVGLFRPSSSRFYLRNGNSSGPSDISFVFGSVTDIPLSGNWDGDSDTTIAVYRGSNRTFYLKNSNTAGGADTSFVFGGSGDTPLSGDWDGNITATVGVYRPSNRTFYLRNSNSAGGADASFVFGGTGDTPIAGDWDGDGDATIGVYRASNRTFYLRNSNSAGAADMSFIFGSSGDKPAIGDWNGDGTDTIGVFRPSQGRFLLRNSNSSGSADLNFTFGSGTDLPLSGDWDGI